MGALTGLAAGGAVAVVEFPGAAGAVVVGSAPAGAFASGAARAVATWNVVGVVFVCVYVFVIFRYRCYQVCCTRAAAIIITNDGRGGADGDVAATAAAAAASTAAAATGKQAKSRSCGHRAPRTGLEDLLRSTYFIAIAWAAWTGPKGAARTKWQNDRPTTTVGLFFSSVSKPFNLDRSSIGPCSKYRKHRLSSPPGPGSAPRGRHASFLRRLWALVFFFCVAQKKKGKDRVQRGLHACVKSTVNLRYITSEQTKFDRAGF